MIETPIPIETLTVSYDEIDRQINRAKAISRSTKDRLLLSGAQPLTAALQRALDDEETTLTPLEQIAWDQIDCCQEAWGTLYFE